MKALNDASWVLLVVGVVLATVLVWSANNRWRAGLAVALAVMLGGLLLWGILVVVAPLADDQLGTQLGRAALEVVVRDLTSSPRFWALIAAGIGLVGAVGAWLGDRQRSRGANPDPIAA